MWGKHTICVRFEIVRYPNQERFHTQVTAQHSDDGAAFQVANVIEDLINFQGILYGNLNRMRATEGIELKRCLNRLSLRCCWATC